MGLNLDIERSHIEPGFYLENFRQRYGRIARRGKGGVLYVHTKSEVVARLSEDINTEKTLLIELEKLLTERDFYVSKTLDTISVYLFLVYKSTHSEEIRSQILFVENKGKLFFDFREFDREIELLVQEGASSVDDRRLAALKEWWHSYLRAYGFFRGQSRTVEVVLPRNDKKRTEEDIVWIKRMTNYEESSDGTTKIIRNYLDHPNNVKLKFKSPKYKEHLSVKWEELKDHGTLVRKWQQEFEECLDDMQETEDSLSATIYKLKPLLPNVLKPITSKLLPPVEVGEVENDLFL